MPLVHNLYSYLLCQFLLILLSSQKRDSSLGSPLKHQEFLWNHRIRVSYLPKIRLRLVCLLSVILGPQEKEARAGTLSVKRPILRVPFCHLLSMLPQVLPALDPTEHYYKMVTVLSWNTFLVNRCGCWGGGDKARAWRSEDNLGVNHLFSHGTKWQLGLSDLYGKCSHLLSHLTGFWNIPEKIKWDDICKLPDV